MSELSPRAKELLRRASRGGGPTERQRRSLKNSVMAAVLMPTLAGALTLKVVLVGFLVAAVSAGVTAGALSALRHPPPPATPVRTVRAVTAPGYHEAPLAPPVLPAQAPELIVPADPPPEVRIVAQPPAPQPAVLAPPRIAATPAVEGSSPPPELSEKSGWAPSLRAPATPSLVHEMESLDRAVRALEAERFDEGLLEAREFLRRFPASEFSTEARVVEALALCGLSRPDEARAAGAKLPAASGGNPAVRRLENSCLQSPLE